jgi:hypothetical protein
MGIEYLWQLFHHIIHAHQKKMPEIKKNKIQALPDHFGHACKIILEKDDDRTRRFIHAHLVHHGMDYLEPQGKIHNQEATVDFAVQGAVPWEIRISQNVYFTMALPHQIQHHILYIPVFDKHQ